ncbi:hypothetical protein BOTBODRAFT_36466 [Botryobasidium botryosum FD-172 SS1]|uniref:Mitochondrial distribution and morphology protein 12 n=1 Tax=Botryobasidium botryosum (strain FD-172 SS1) TaxID=930990 RepID=A0A067M3P2_BOTB1|nr:hypothetical protein BOTBODRAFT_36466 [Botryobasidium botryosum FD-172 SS1]
MSIDLDWASLSPIFCDRLVSLLNTHLSTANRPSFIGPINVTSLSLGSSSPDVEVVDVRDIYRDFLEDDELSDSDDFPPPDLAPEERIGAQELTRAAGRDGFEWVPQREGSPLDGPAHRQLPRRYSQDPFIGTEDGRTTPSSASGGPRLLRSGLLLSHSIPSLSRPLSFTPMNRLSPSPVAHTSSRPQSQTFSSSLASESHSHQSDVPPPAAPPPVPLSSLPPPPTDLQVHLRIAYTSDVRIRLTTSLTINYPSSMFMSLPVSLAITGLVFRGELVVAYEGSRKRIHLCILDDLDHNCPLRPASAPLGTSGSGSGSGNAAAGEENPLPVGNRLLPTILIESEIGAADKHMLRNVSRVERFIQDVMRKTIEEELVFPNFHTLILPESSGDNNVG